MSSPILTVAVRYERDIVLARQRARQIASLFGYPKRDQARIATAVSEIARNAFRYAGGGKVEFLLRVDRPQALEIRIDDQGPGIPHLQEILDGRYVSRTGLGLGILGARRLMDEFHIQASSPGGTTLTMGALLPSGLPPVTSEKAAAAGAELARELPLGELEEIQRQNQELLAALDDLQKRQTELAQLNKELEDTNRGVVALYAELDERADYLRRISESKTQFLSNMTHEFRTPVNSILSLSRILLDLMDGPLTPEQERQVQLIQGAAGNLSELVNDLLDLAKVEAGKTTIRPREFRVESLFGALRGMLRPFLAHNTSVNLIFDSQPGMAPLFTDESKVSQILRNLLSNALKFTETGEVRVNAWFDPGDVTVFAVTDTGIGIAPADQERVFAEFTQVEGIHQVGKKGTGLGLPLSRKLAELLGGDLTLRSEPGVGSTFTLRVPSVYRGPVEVSVIPDRPAEADPTRHQVLVVEDNPETIFVYEKFLKGTCFQPMPARTLTQAREVLGRCWPVAVVLDILLAHENSWSFISELKANPALRNVPVFVVTVVENRHKALALGARDFHAKPVERAWLLQRLQSAAAQRQPNEILVVDDDEAAHTVVRKLLRETRFRVLGASGGREGLRLAQERKPAAVILDLVMPDLHGLEVLRLLRADSVTAQLPVVVNTSKALSAEEFATLVSLSAPCVSKNHSDPSEQSLRLREALVKAGLKQSALVCPPT